VTDPAPTERPTLPPDPAAYDHPRAELARAKGLGTPYIPGGADPDPERARREERRLLRLLLAMVITVVLAGFVFGVLTLLVTRPA
jgi:hypothetical protein